MASVAVSSLSGDGSSGGSGDETRTRFSTHSSEMAAADVAYILDHMAKGGASPKQLGAVAAALARAILAQVSERIQKQVVLAAVAAEDLRPDRKFVLAAGDASIARERAAEKLWAERGIGGDAFDVAADDLRADRELVLAASIGFALDTKHDPGSEIVLASWSDGDAAKDGAAFESAAVDLRIDGNEIAVEELRADRRDTAAKDGEALGSAAEDLRMDREIGHVAGQAADDDAANGGDALESAAEDLRIDGDEVAVEELRADRCDAAAKDGYALASAAADLRTDREIVPAAEARGVAEHAAEDMQADRENCNIMLAAVAAEHVRADRTVVLAAGEASIALEVAAENLRADREFVLAT